MSLTNLSNGLTASGDVEGALQRAQQASEIYRRLAESNPSRFEPDYAMSLSNLSAALAIAGKNGARQAIRQSIEIYRHLTDSNPSRFEPELAQSLNNLAAYLGALGDVEGALQVLQEAIGLIRPYAEKYPEGRFGVWHRAIQANLERFEHEAPSELGSSS